MIPDPPRVPGLLVENKFGLSLLDAEELIDIRVHLVTEFLYSELF